MARKKKRYVAPIRTRTFPKGSGKSTYKAPVRTRTFPKKASNAPTPPKPKRPKRLGKTTVMPKGKAPYNPIPKDPKTGKPDTDRFLRKTRPTRSSPKPNPPKPTRKPPRAPAASPSVGKLDLGGASAASTLALILKQAQDLAKQRVAPTMTDSLLQRMMERVDPSVRSETEASMAYDSTIQDLQRQIAQASGSVEGIMGDIDRYYGVLDTSNAEAKASDAAMLAGNVDEAGDAAKAFMAAAGGGAQEGNTSVAAQAAINDANLRAMGTAQTNFDSSLGQFFDMAQASQKAGIRSEIERSRSDLATQLANAQRERSMFKSKLAADYGDNNLDLALQLKETLYNQRKDASDTQWNRVLGLANLTGMAATLPNEVEQSAVATAKSIEDWKSQILLNQQQRAQLQQFQDQYSGGEQNPFSQLDPGTRAKLAASLQANLLGPKGYLTVNPNQFLSTLRNRLYNVAGYSRTPQTEQYIKSLLEPRYINWWNKYHPKQKYTP